MLTLPLVFLAISSQATAPADAKVTDLGDGYVRVSTEIYSIEVPKGWVVSRETPWGQRKATNEAGELGVMTAGNTRSTWDELYRTSLFFIQRERKGKPTPYEITKTAQGYEACTFSILDEEGFADRRYVLLKSKAGEAIALSVQIRDRKATKDLVAHFDRLVKSAKILKN